MVAFFQGNHPLTTEHFNGGMGFEENFVLSVVFLPFGILKSILVKVREGFLVRVVLWAVDAHFTD